MHHSGTIEHKEEGPYTLHTPNMRKWTQKIVVEAKSVGLRYMLKVTVDIDM